LKERQLRNIWRCKSRAEQKREGSSIQLQCVCLLSHTCHRQSHMYPGPQEPQTHGAPLHQRPPACARTLLLALPCTLIPACAWRSITACHNTLPPTPYLCLTKTLHWHPRLISCSPPCPQTLLLALSCTLSAGCAWCPQHFASNPL
jgi:hypothetical protein